MQVAFHRHSVLGCPPSRTRQVALQTQTTEPIPETLRQQLARLDQKRASFAGLSAPVLESLNGSLRIELTYASNAIEGNGFQSLVAGAVERRFDLAAGGKIIRNLSVLETVAWSSCECDAPPFRR